ncbi:glycerophosphoryl diester phosphodiesterase [Aureimonas endophytica]|uniref:Glycerophosphoryl diester phosphodiesterase n=1 Tax=Aureimonas endophytica TaxID=2027858 RepID=A0A917A0W4_9HYPH|nr:glycerophosphodiester phosphodiesterase family protein [Aureimonas endophytica]GGE20441.1 glycerophosphoryl diester phosphodiesterase [Aureimonas endophytica]
MRETNGESAGAVRGAAGVALDRDGHRCLLKWHRGRRRAGDLAFTAARIAEGMALGASMEIDLRRHGGGGFAVLHDEDLHPATTGRGPVAAAGRETLRGLRLAAPDGAPTDHPVLLLEDLARIMARAGGHPEALLQLDMKTPAAAIGPADAAAFAETVGPVARWMILSSGDAASAALLSRACPELRLGYDPCHDDSAAELRASGDFSGFVAQAVAAAPEAGMIYLDHELVLLAEERGFDLVGAFHGEGRTVDAYTIASAAPENLRTVERLLALKVDQITTDDPEGLEALVRGRR